MFQVYVSPSGAIGQCGTINHVTDSVIGSEGSSSIYGSSRGFGAIVRPAYSYCDNLGIDNAYASCLVSHGNIYPGKTRINLGLAGFYHPYIKV